MSLLEGKTALVTGASRGIGRGIALELARAGADLAICYRREADDANTCAEEVRALGRRAFTFAADVRDADAVADMVQSAARELGRLDCVVANAGVASRFEPLHEVHLGYWERVLQIDLFGVYYTLRAALPILREQKSGVLLTVSSIAADLCMPNGGPYVAAKAAVNALTKVAARENAALGVRANIISPGLVKTDIAKGMTEEHGEEILRSIPLGRPGTPEEIGKLAVYLASDAAAWVTGKNFRIDGGAQ